MTEYEYKILIPQEKFENLYKEYSKSYFSTHLDKRVQLNYYYDTTDYFLFKNNITLRIRQINENLKLEIKTEKTKERLPRIAEESSFEIDRIPMFIDSNILPTDFAKHYVLLGDLVTERTRFLTTDGVELCFDKNWYLGAVDYEFEVEYEKEKEYLAKKTFEQLSEGIEKSRFKTKYNRFIKAYRKMKDNDNSGQCWLDCNNT